MNTCIYAINLDRSVDRWNALSRQAAELNFDLVRIPGVDGSRLPAVERIDCDERAFERNNGRMILPGEYGCYRSHLKALAAFLETGRPVGVIVEDDIELSASLLTRVDAAVEALPGADVIKLFNHRIVWFKRYATSSAGDEVGRTAHGPQGSAACYVVTRAGAAKVIKGLGVMEYPWDIALERGWAYGARIYTTQRDVAVTKRDSTTIATRSVYRASKFPWWQRLKTYGVRIIEAVRRIAYAFRG